MIKRLACIMVTLAVPLCLPGYVCAEAPGAHKKIETFEFLKARRGRRWTHVPLKVLSFYYSWYGRPERHGRWVHWRDVKLEEHYIAASTHYPAKVAYGSHHPAIIDYRIGLAKDHGVDGFICTWWGQGTFDDTSVGEEIAGD